MELQAAGERPGSSCAAPSTSLFFAANGDVLSCCVNLEHPVGNVGRSSLREIWDGVRRDDLRRALAAADYSLGCRQCDPETVPGGEGFSHARQFDAFGDADDVYPRRMDFSMSNRCNLECVMCHGEYSSKIRRNREHRPPMEPRYGDAFFEELREFLPHLEVSFFLGGEPFLQPEVRRVWDLMIELGLDVPVNVVTNGTQWNDRVEHYLRSLDMALSVSIDGADPATTAAIRVGADRDEIMANVARYRAIVEPKGGNVVVNYCLMRDNWSEFHGFLAEADELGLDARAVTVTDPVRFSLYALEPDDLELVVRSMEAMGSASPLQRNAAVWHAEVARLDHHLRQVRCVIAYDADTLTSVRAELERADGERLFATVVRSGDEPSDWFDDADDAAVATLEATIDEQDRSATHLTLNRRLWDTRVRPLTRVVSVWRAALAELERWSGAPPVVLSISAGTVWVRAHPLWASILGLPDWEGAPADSLMDLAANGLGPVEVGAPDVREDGSTWFDVGGGDLHLASLFRVATVEQLDGSARVGIAISPEHLAARFAGVDDVWRAAVDELEAWSGASSIRLSVVDGVVHVDARPGWSSSLALSEWEGAPADDLMALAAGVGPVEVGAPDVRSDGSTWFDVAGGDPWRSAWFRFVTVEQLDRTARVGVGISPSTFGERANTRQSGANSGTGPSHGG